MFILGRSLLRILSSIVFIEDYCLLYNMWSQKCSELRSHFQYNVKLSLITSFEQRKSMLRREKCQWSSSYSRHFIVSANKTVSKLLKQASNGCYSNQIPKSFSYSYILTTRRGACRILDLKLPFSVPLH